MADNGSNGSELLSKTHNPSREISLTGHDPTNPKAVLLYDVFCFLNLPFANTPLFLITVYMTVV